MTADLFGLDPVPGVDAPDVRQELRDAAAAFAIELRACTDLAAYAEVVSRLLTYPLSGLLFTLVPPALPGRPPERLGALVATTRHELTPPAISRGTTR